MSSARRQSAPTLVLAASFHLSRSSSTSPLRPSFPQLPSGEENATASGSFGVGMPLWGRFGPFGVLLGQVLFIREALHVLMQSALKHDHSSAAADNRGEWDPCHRCPGCSLVPCPLAPTKRSTASTGPDLMDSVTTNLCATRPLLEAVHALRCRDKCTSALGYPLPNTTTAPFYGCTDVKRRCGGVTDNIRLSEMTNSSSFHI